MFSNKFSIFKICKDFIESNCDSNRISDDEKNLQSFSTFLLKDKHDNFCFSDDEFSIKCIFQENCLKNFFSANEIIRFENITKLEVAMEIENNKTRPKENVPNINRNKEIHEGLMNFLSTQIQTKSKSFFESSFILKALNFENKELSLKEQEYKLTENSNKNSFELFDKKDPSKALLINENIEIDNSKGLFEIIDDSNGNLKDKDLYQSANKREDLDTYKNVNLSSIFNKQPTQLKNINNNKLKANKEMENLMVVEDNPVNPIVEGSIEDEMQMLNKKRKKSDGLTELRNELLDKMPSDVKDIIEKYKTMNFNIELLEKYRFYKKYGGMNVKLLK